MEVSLRQRLDTPFKLLMGLLSSHGLQDPVTTAGQRNYNIGALNSKVYVRTGEDCCAVSVRNLELKLPVPQQRPSRVSPCGQTLTYFVAPVTVLPGAPLMCLGPGIKA